MSDHEPGSGTGPGPEQSESHDEDLIERVRTAEPSAADAELEGDKLIAYEDAPGAGLLGAVDDLPEPNEPG